MDDDVYDDETTNHEIDDEEQFQIQTGESDNNYVLVNTRIDYQYRSDILNGMCLYGFVSSLYKKKMNAADRKYLTRLKHPAMKQLIKKAAHPTNVIHFKNSIRKHRHISWSNIASPAYLFSMALKFRDGIGMILKNDIAGLFSHFSSLGVPFLIFAAAAKHGKMRFKPRKLSSLRTPGR